MMFRRASHTAFCGVLVRKAPARLDDCPHLAIDVLERVGGVDHASNGWGKGEERDHLGARPSPLLDDHGVGRPPGSALQGTKRGGCDLRGRRGVHRAQCGGDGFAILPAHKVQAVPNQLHDAGLQRRLGIRRLEGGAHAGQAIRYGDGDGLTVREIQALLREMYAVDVSPDLISSVTDAIVEEVTAWQNRPLERMYPLVSSSQ